MDAFSMLDGISLDQLRTFVAAADEGSFSAAGRKLNRVQSAVSGWVGGLEDRIGVVLFDRSGRFPKLTAAGVVLLADARNIVAGVDTLKARARSISTGVEAELSVVVDVFVPTAVISATAKAFGSRFPLTPLRLFVEGLGAAYEPVLAGRCSVGLVATLPLGFPTLIGERVGEVPLVFVAAAGHPLATFGGRVPRRELARHVQLVLTDRSELLAGQDYGVLSSSTWRLADLSTKYAFLKEGVGWGSMPLHIVAQDIVAGMLVELAIEDVPTPGVVLTVSAVHRAMEPPGPAARWFVEQVRGAWDGQSRQAAAPVAPAVHRRKRRKPAAP